VRNAMGKPPGKEGRRKWEGEGGEASTGGGGGAAHSLSQALRHAYHIYVLCMYLPDSWPRGRAARMTRARGARGVDLRQRLLSNATLPCWRAFLAARTPHGAPFSFNLACPCIPALHRISQLTRDHSPLLNYRLELPPFAFCAYSAPLPSPSIVCDRLPAPHHGIVTSTVTAVPYALDQTLCGCRICHLPFLCTVARSTDILDDGFSTWFVGGRRYAYLRRTPFLALMVATILPCHIKKKRVWGQMTGDNLFLRRHGACYKHGIFYSNNLKQALWHRGALPLLRCALHGNISPS